MYRREPSVTHIAATTRYPRHEDTGPRYDDYHVSWLPSEGWWCDCPKTRACPHIALVQATAGAGS